MRNGVCTYEFTRDRLSGAALKAISVLAEPTRECMATGVSRWMRSQDAILTLSRLVELYRRPRFRCGNGAAFIPKGEE